MKGKVNCTCGWSWNKSDSSKKDMYICHECGRDNSNNMKNGGWLDNYNDSQASAPEGMVGDGYSNVGRNYSPAWGGQFEEGGEIPMAQNGRATRADSLDVYNRSLKIDAYYDNLKKKGWYPKKDIYPTTNLTSKDLEKEMKQVDEESRKTYIKQAKQPKEVSLLKNMYPNANPKLVNQKALKEHIALTKGTRYASKDNAPSVIDPMAPTTVIDTRIIPKEAVAYNSREIAADDLFYRTHPNATKKELDNYEKSKGSKFDKYTPPGGLYTYLYRYDPLSVKPWDMLTDAEKKLRVDKYGTDGVPKSYIDKNKPAPNKTKKSSEDISQNRKPIEPIQIKPAGLVQNDFNIEADVPQIRQQVEQPEYYNVTSQRQTMSGPSDYYNYNKQKMNVDDAVRAAESAEVYNKYIEDKYGNEEALKNPKAQERLKQLKQNIQVVPQAQTGMSMPGSVGFTYARTKGIPSEGPYAKKTMPSAQEGKKLNPFTYPQPDHYAGINPFFTKDPESNIFIGGISPSYSTKDFSIGASAVGVGNEDFMELPVDYGIRGSYNPTDSLSVNASLSKNNIGAGIKYRFENGGNIAQNGEEMQYYREGLDFQPKTISKNGGIYPIAEEGFTTTEETTRPDFSDAKNFLSKLIDNTKSKKTRVKIEETHNIINDNIQNAHKEQIKADEKIARDVTYQKKVALAQSIAQANAQKEFNALPKEEQERILYNQSNQENGTISEYTPDSKISKFAQSMVTPFTALTDLYQTGEVRDNLLQSVVNNPKSANAYDAAYLGALGYAAAPLVPAVANAAAPYATMIGNSLATDAVIGGNTIAGLNLGNAITAGFGAHGAMNIAPDTAEWLDNPSWEKAGEVGIDALELAPVIGPMGKTLGEGFGYMGDKVAQAKNIIAANSADEIQAFKEASSNVLGKIKQYGKNIRGLATGEKRKAGEELNKLYEFENDIYNSKEYLANEAEGFELNQSLSDAEKKLRYQRAAVNNTLRDDLSKKIDLKQGRINTANTLTLTDEGIVQSGKNTSLGLRTGSTDIVDLETGVSTPISTSVPNEDILFKLEGDKVIKSSNTKTLPEATPEYKSTVKKNIDFIEKQVPGAKVFGSAKNVAEAEVPHIIGDYDVIMSQTQYDKFSKNNPIVSTNGFAKVHDIPGAAKGIEPIDINVIEEVGGKATGTRAQELFRQVAPDDFYAAAKEAIKNKSEIKIPYSSQELVDMTNPSSKSIVDAYESTKPKHLNKIDALINYGKPSVVAEGQQQYVKSLVGSKGTIGPQFPLEQLSDVTTNKQILDRINFIGNKQLVAADPERMQIALNDYYINNSILVRQVDKGPVDKIEAAIKEYYPQAGGGAINGIGQNHVTLGFPNHGWDNVTSVKQIGMDLNTSNPIAFLDDLEHQTSGSKLFTEEESKILSDIVDSMKEDNFKSTGIDLRKGVGKAKDVIKQSKNSSELIERLPYSEEGKQALYEFAKKTNRQMAKKDYNYGSSNYASTLRDFDEAIDAMQYSALNQVEMNKVLKSHTDRLNASKSQISKQIDELLPKQYKGLKGYLEGGIDRATERLAALNKEKFAVGDDIKELAKKYHNNKYKEEITRVKEYQKNIQKQIYEMSQMRTDLRTRQVELIEFKDKFKNHVLLTIGGGALGGLYKLHTYEQSPEQVKRREQRNARHIEEFKKREAALEKMSPAERKKAEDDAKGFVQKSFDFMLGTNKKNGGIINSDRGQWDHPGKKTRIKGGNITMKPDPKTGKPLTQPILGIASTGQRQMMYPGQDYNFPNAEYVTEYPKGKMAQNGIRQEQKGLVNLNQLTNFTNYNTKQPGGWLDTL